MKAAVLAGGMGTRLSPFTANFPKPLMPLDNRMPVLELLLRQMRAAGIGEVFLAVNHFHQLLRAYFGDGQCLGLKIHYSLESEPLGTAGPLAAMLGELGERFFVANGDLLTTLDFGTMLEEHRQIGAAATIAAVERQERVEFGLLETNAERRLTAYIEKPVVKNLVSMGCYVLERDAVSPYLRPSCQFDMPDLIRAMMSDDRHVHCHAPECFWLDIGRPDDYAKAQEIFGRDPGMFLPR